MARRHAILILGVHRSGTSALTRVLSLCGAGLPKTLFPAVPGDNDAGYWESSRVIDFHQWLLWHLGTGMLDPTLPDPRWLATPEAADVAKRLAGLLQEEWGEHPCWVLKEPRLCRLVPLWRRALELCGRDAVAVHCLREPAEVASSLHRRDGFSRAVAEILWFQHVTMAERDTRDLPRSFVTYDSLFAGWDRALKRVAGQLPPGVLDVASGSAEIATFLDPSLRRQRSDSESLADPHIEAVRVALLTACDQHREPDIHLIDQAWDAVAAGFSVGSPRG